MSRTEQALTPGVLPAVRAQLGANPRCTPKSEGGDADRVFEFDRRRGEWAINGETWHSALIAADVSNTYMYTYYGWLVTGRCCRA